MVNSFPLFVWLSLTHADRSRAIVLLPSPESVAVVGAVPAAATLVSLNAIVTFTSFALSRASPLAFFTKSRPVDNVSWILYTYFSYPVVSGIAPVTVYVTT